MSDARHHHATRPAVIFVEVPVAGSPEPARHAKRPRYPSDKREPWRPATRPPNKRSPAEFKRLLDVLSELDRRATDARRMLTPRPEALLTRRPDRATHGGLAHSI